MIKKSLLAFLCILLLSLSLLVHFGCQDGEVPDGGLTNEDGENEPDRGGASNNGNEADQGDKPNADEPSGDDKLPEGDQAEDPKPCTHTFGAWKTVDPPACEKAGEKERTCTVCGETETDVISATGHRAGGWETLLSADCENDGVLVKYCVFCPTEMDRSTAKASGHTYIEAVTPPTLTSDGYRGEACSACGHERGGVTLTAQNYFSEGLTYHTLTDTTCAVSAIGSCTDTSVFIPATAPDGKTVVALWGSAFYRNKRIVEVHIPDTVTIIYGTCFIECSSLERVRFSENLTEIGMRAFEGCRSLRELDFSRTALATFGESVFYGCSSIETVTLPKGLSTIPKDLFRNCRGLKTVYLDDSTVSVGESAFRGDESLTFCGIKGDTKSLYTLSYVGSNAFEGTSLANVVFSSKLQILGMNAFASFKGESVDFSQTAIEGLPNACFQNSSVKRVVLPPKTSVIGSACFQNCYRLTELALPSSLSRIANHAFQSSGIQKLMIPSRVSTIEDYAFSGMTGEITFASSYTSLRSVGWCFRGYLGTAITIPDSVTTVRSGAFAECTNLKYFSSPMVNAGNTSKHCFVGLFSENADCWEPEKYPKTIRQVAITSGSADNTRYFLGLSIPELVISFYVTDLTDPTFEDTEIGVIYYDGDREGWEAVADAITAFKGKKVYFYSEVAPAGSGYWHYVNGVATPW